VGTDADTGEFAVESIRRCWNTMGTNTYPDATRLLMTADAGGSNGSCHCRAGYVRYGACHAVALGSPERCSPSRPRTPPTRCAP